MLSQEKKTVLIIRVIFSYKSVRDANAEDRILPGAKNQLSILKMHDVSNSSSRSCDAASSVTVLLEYVLQKNIPLVLLLSDKT